MGIGIWSNENGLSEGLPLDVIQMLATERILKAQMDELKPSKPFKCLLLIADSMAIREGAAIYHVTQRINDYLKKLHVLLNKLDLKDSTAVVLSSEIEGSEEFQKIESLIAQTDLMKYHWTKDKVHSAYMQAQTAITHYIHACRDVGFKIGWLKIESSKCLNQEGIKNKLIEI